MGCAQSRSAPFQNALHIDQRVIEYTRMKVKRFPPQYSVSHAAVIRGYSPRRHSLNGYY